MTSRSEAIDCREAMQQLYDFLDGELSEESIQRIRHHIEKCRPCYAHTEFERDLLAVVAEGWRDVSASEQLRARIRRSLTEVGFAP